MIFVLLLLYKRNDQKDFKMEIFLSTIFSILLKNIFDNFVRSTKFYNDFRFLLNKSLRNMLYNRGQNLIHAIAYTVVQNLLSIGA